MPGKMKPKDLEFSYAVGDVVRLKTGQNTVILEYGIYSGQYFCVKHFDDGIHIGSADYLCSPEDPDAYMPDIVGIEDDAEKVLRVLRDYVKADADMTAKVAAWNLRTPEPGTSVIRWTLYDGTPETLPERGAEILLKHGKSAIVVISQCVGADADSTIWRNPPFVPERGDLWALLPEPPEGMK